MIRDKVEVHCDAPGCKRSTEATTKTAFGVHCSVQFPQNHDGTESEWLSLGGRHYCPDHRGKAIDDAYSALRRSPG